MFGNKKKVRELEERLNALCFHLGVEVRKVPATASFVPEHYKIVSFRETAKKAEEQTHGILRCSKCQTLKPSYQFHKNSKLKTGKNSYCKLCMTKYSRAYKAKRAKQLLVT